MKIEEIETYRRNGYINEGIYSQKLKINNLIKYIYLYIFQETKL